MNFDYEGAMSDLHSAITVLIHRINREKDLASAAEWVKRNYPGRADEIVAWKPTHKHVKRGTFYRVLSEGHLQMEGPNDNAQMIVYEDETGYVWVRPKSEFFDGRFEPVIADNA